MDEERKRYLLKDVIDLHVHTGPSISPRQLDVGEMARDAMKYGYLGFVAKDHYFPSAPATITVNKYMANGKEIAYSTMVMNNSVGGFNLKAVSTAVEMGSFYISMPTVSAQEHINFNQRPGVIPFKATGKSSVAENPIPFLDENGEVDPDAVKILQYLSKHPEVTLATGHGSAAEVDAVIKKALEVGIKKIHVNHPYFIVGADMETMGKWAKWGAYIELCAYMIVPYSTTRHEIDTDMLKELVRIITPQQCLLVTDMGQAFNKVWPSEAMADLMEKMMTDAGCTENATFIMGKQNPAKMLNLL